MAIPCQAFVFQTKEGVETLRTGPKSRGIGPRESPGHKHFLVAVKAVVGKKISRPNGLAGSSPATSTTNFSYLTFKSLVFVELT